jgi:uncharacterized protein YehS (DUF1456 family)
MNNYELVEAVRYLLEQRQSELLKKTSRSAVAEEIEEIEEYIEMAREGYTE